MAIKLDDFLSKKKEPAQVLDLSHVRITTKEEFRKYFDKIPEYKIKPEKVLPESIKIRDKDFSFTPSRREGRVTDYNYLDPTPPDMKGVHLEDLCPVSIDWKMLTTLRPKTKQEEDMFSRLVQLGKLDLKYQQNLKRGKDTDWIRRTKKPRSSIVETRVLSCKECGEDFCDGSQCCKVMYENFFRIQPSIATGVVKDAAGLEGGDESDKKKKKKKRRGRRRKRSMGRRKLRKNSIFNRPASRGCNRDHSKCGRPAPGSAPEGRSVSHDRGRRFSRRSSLSPGLRARSAPRIQFKGVGSDGEGAMKKSGFTSESAVSQSDYSTQSDSESPQRRVEFATLDQGPLSSRRGFIRKCTLSDASEWSDSHKRVRRPFTTGEWNWRERGDTTSDNSDSSPSPDRFRPLRPSKIQLEFKPNASATTSRRSLPQAGPSRSARSSTNERREARQLAQGLSRIELAFVDDTPSSAPAQRRQRARLQRSARIRTSPPNFKPSSAFLQGTGLFSKSAETAPHQSSEL